MMKFTERVQGLFLWSTSSALVYMDILLWKIKGIFLLTFLLFWLLTTQFLNSIKAFNASYVLGYNSQLLSFFIFKFIECINTNLTTVELFLQPILNHKLVIKNHILFFSLIIFFKENKQCFFFSFSTPIPVLTPSSLPIPSTYHLTPKPILREG